MRTHIATWERGRQRDCLDMTALGRQETWEDSPEGSPRSRPYKWWNWRESYAPDAASLVEPP